MDVVSHWLWGTLVTRKRVHWKVSGPMSVLPDLVAFVPSAIYSFATGMERTGVDETTTTAEFPSIAWNMYQLSHSIVISGVLMLVTMAFLIRHPHHRLTSFITSPSSRPFTLAFLIWLPWFVHILVDIPTHTLRFFPTPVLYPLSDAMFDGVRWSHPVIWFSNLALLTGLWGFVLYRERKSNHPNPQVSQ